MTILWKDIQQKKKPEARLMEEVRSLPVDMVDIPVFTGLFFTSQVVVWDFWTIKSISPWKGSHAPWLFPFNFEKVTYRGRPTQTSCTSIKQIPQNYHRFEFFDPTKMRNFNEPSHFPPLFNNKKMGKKNIFSTKLEKFYVHFPVKKRLEPWGTFIPS